MIALYHNDMSVCAQKVRLTLAEKQLSWESHHLDLRAGDQQNPEYLKLNPNAVVPGLVDDGAVIIESTVICQYCTRARDHVKAVPTGCNGSVRERSLTSFEMTKQLFCCYFDRSEKSFSASKRLPNSN